MRVKCAIVSLTNLKQSETTSNLTTNEFTKATICLLTNVFNTSWSHKNALSIASFRKSLS